MARIDIPEGTGPDIYRVWGLRPEMAAGPAAMADTVYDKSQLPARVREAARMAIAVTNQCQVCLGWRDEALIDAGVDETLYGLVIADELESLSPAEALAVRYARLFATDHLAIDDELMGEMRATFGDAGVLDLTICCANWVGLGRLNQVLGLDTGCAVPRGVHAGH